MARRSPRRGPEILVRKNVGFVSHQLPRFNEHVEADRSAMKRLGIKAVDKRGRPIIASKKELREFLARSKGENESYYHEWD